MQWFDRMRRRIGMSLLGGTPFYDGIGGGRRALAWQVSNPGAVAALAFTQNELRAKSRDLVRRNAWAAAGVEAFVSNAIGTGIKPQSMLTDQPLREAIHSLWWDWCEDADAAGLTRARSSGFAISDGAGHLGGAVGALALPAVIAATSFQFGFVGIGVTGLAAGVLALAGPNVTGRRLEAVSG